MTLALVARPPKPDAHDIEIAERIELHLEAVGILREMQRYRIARERSDELAGELQSVLARLDKLDEGDA